MNGASVVSADLEVDNGVIHVIDSLILPPLKPDVFLRAMPGVCAPLGFFDPLGACAATKPLRPTHALCPVCHPPRPPLLSIDHPAKNHVHVCTHDQSRPRLQQHLHTAVQ